MFRRILTRFAARFLAQAFFMLISFIFTYSETFFVVFHLSFHFALGQDPSAVVGIFKVLHFLRCKFALFGSDTVPFIRYGCYWQ